MEYVTTTIGMISICFLIVWKDDYYYPYWTYKTIIYDIYQRHINFIFSILYLLINIILFPYNWIRMILDFYHKSKEDQGMFFNVLHIFLFYFFTTITILGGFYLTIIIGFILYHT